MRRRVVGRGGGEVLEHEHTDTRQMYIQYSHRSLWNSWLVLRGRRMLVGKVLAKFLILHTTDRVRQRTTLT